LLKHEDKTLGIRVKPSEVRLTSNDEELDYAWQINDASLEIIFRKNLSKHISWRIYEIVPRSWAIFPCYSTQKSPKGTKYFILKLVSYILDGPPPVC
jgi:hypothetical protein